MGGGREKGERREAREKGEEKDAIERRDGMNEMGFWEASGRANVL